jgi:hypothetical protein
VYRGHQYVEQVGQRLEIHRVQPSPKRNRRESPSMLTC